MNVLFAEKSVNSVLIVMDLSKFSLESVSDHFRVHRVKLETQKVFYSQLPARLLKVGSPVGFSFL